MSGLLFDLAGVTNDHDAVEFVGHYGLLRGGWQEPWADWEYAVTYLRSHLELHETFRRATLGRSAALEDLRARGYGDTGRASVLTMVATSLEVTINNGLRGTEERIRSTREDSARHGVPAFESATHPPDVVGFAFAQLKRLVVGRTPVRACAECKRFFEVDDARRRFHSTQCQNRATWRKWKKAHPKRRRAK